MKIALTGASGLQGMSALLYLLEQDDVEEIQASDISHLERLRERVEHLGDPRIVMRTLDCTDEAAAAAAFKGYHVVVNCAFTPGRFLNVTRAALAAGAHYLDLTSAGEEPKQKALHEEFKKKGITAILDMGTAPGLSNLMAVYCMNRLDRTESIDYKWAVVDVVPPAEHTRPLYWGYGIEGIMYLVSAPSWVYEDGQVRNEEPRARPERFRFKDPVGEQVIMGFPHPEPRMLAESFPDAGFKHIMYRQAFDPDSEKKYCFLRDLGFHRLDPIEVKGVKVAPFDVLKTLLDQLPPERKKPAHIISEGNCIAQGWKDGKKVEVRLMIRTSPDSDMHRRYTAKGAFGSYRTGICGAMAGVMLGRGLIEKKGVYPPELCVPADLYIREQVNVGMEVEESVTAVLS
jgi:lysine 6-dehydrogenase